ncbi:hypothetical protein N7509_010330 [Penicillium cosmopolitanum]|uniref:MARVEL domain-containing protein n=1 Tax=Penicillium cosmopolitanum TaxID=1131564 RepID=A0A9W9VR86_9EURO|nr:uncharacterized protein N7509_010330 [Penicillium cosmopolitanum]KAJ5387789.1 hypothetical protein N7509_010330 [Penicillium cosmopolitanum]
MRSKMRSNKITSVKPSIYPALTFNIIRAAALLASIVVGLILAVFIYHLHADGYKLPFAFLILLITAVFSLLNVLFTTVINCSCGLSPKLSIIFNIILLLLWLLSLALLSYSMSGTILTKCTTADWANSTGISVCRSYKALFSFTVIGTAAYIASIALDVIVRRRVNRLGVYNPMESAAMLGEDPADVKLANRRSDPFAYDPDPTPPVMAGGNHYGDVPAYSHAYSHSYSNSLDNAHAQESSGFLDNAHAGTGPRVRFGSDQGYPPSQTHYDPAGYR